MIRTLLFSITLLFPSIELVETVSKDQEAQRLKELDSYWTKLSKTVIEGDFEGYKAAYHKDAVVIFATRENKTSMSIHDALAGWKQGFDDTKAGKRKDHVEFRLSQRIGNESTAHETGIFYFTSENGNSESKFEDYVHFEMLLVKQDGQWLGLMEYQKSHATKAEWDALK